MTIADAIVKMIDFYQGNLQEIGHFLKVYSYAKTIGEREGLTPARQTVLELAAVLHDIACPLCREKYGSCDGRYQEAESEALVRTFLKGEELDPAVLERVVFLVSHHHTYTGVDGIDYQILLEADFLVNAHESRYEKAAIQAALEGWYQTETGKHLLRSAFGV